MLMKHKSVIVTVSGHHGKVERQFVSVFSSDTERLYQSKGLSAAQRHDGTAI